MRRYTAQDALSIIETWNTDYEMADEDIEDDISDNEDSLEILPNEEDDDNDHSESESDLDENEDNNIMTIGKDKTRWTFYPKIVPGRISVQNMFRITSGVPRVVSGNVSTPYNAWKHFIDERILRLVVKCTLQKAQRRSDNYFMLTVDELEAFIALQYCRGLYGKGHPIAFLWNAEYGISIFSKTMARDRFYKILKYLRFDDKALRIRSGAGFDKFSPCREVFELFVKNCESKFVANCYLTIDEQLLPIKSRCGFISFMPNKPDKHGLKF